MAEGAGNQGGFMNTQNADRVRRLKRVLALMPFPPAPVFLSLEDAQEFCKRKGVDSVTKYKAFYTTHKNTGLPCSPHQYYKISLPEFFGRLKTVFMSLKNARAFCKRVGLDGQNKYRAFRKTHKNTGLPSDPRVFYGIRWREFFGKTKPVFMSLKKAQSFCKLKGLDTCEKYQAFYKTHKGLPANVPQYYGVSWNEFFGKKPKRRRAS
jgi:hypothetical protein